MKRDGKDEHNYGFFAHDLGELVKRARRVHDNRADPEVVKEMVSYIVEGFVSGHCGPIFYNGTARNDGVKTIVDALNSLKGNEVFQDDYSVSYNVDGTSVEKKEYQFAVFPGSDKMGLSDGEGEPQILCKSEDQAKHMLKFWGPTAHYEKLE